MFFFWHFRLTIAGEKDTIGKETEKSARRLCFKERQASSFMTKTIITIARQYGSGGRLIGKKLSEILEVPFYDKELIALAAKQSGMSEEVFAKADERASSSLLYSLVMGSYTSVASNMPINDKLFLLQTDIIKKAAKEGPFVIVGRCADCILRDEPNCLNLFLQAPKDVRIRRAIEEYGEDASKAADAVSKKDKQRGNYYNFYSNRKWGDMQNYDLILDTHTFGLQGTVDIILRALEEKEKTYGKPVPDADL